MRPLQLALSGDDLPPAPPLLLEALPEEVVAVAIEMLARLMAEAVRPRRPRAAIEGSMDE